MAFKKHRDLAAIEIVYSFFLDYVDVAVTVYWIFAIALYSLKLISKKFNRYLDRKEREKKEKINFEKIGKK